MFAALTIEGIGLSPWFPLFLVLLIIAGLFAPEIYQRVIGWFTGIGGKKGADIDTLFKAIEAAGFSYEPEQDIFFSKLDAWQRKKGYCRLYDEAAAPLGMIIDCEPIYFTYAGKRWLIEFWKGQYGLTSGGEIGVYQTEAPDLNIPGVFKGPFFHSASNSELLKMKFSLKKNGETLFRREDKHWWLTGFILGEFSEPWELTMHLKITLKDKTMRDAFVKGLKQAGYLDQEIVITGNTVGLKFDETRTQQPFTRIAPSDWITQRKNERLCDQYQNITRGHDNFPDKMKAIKERAPRIYEKILNLGKTKQLFEDFESIKDYLKE